ncbi:pyrimidine reductase family protein [Ruicaihuangia caeni]|uniref:Pyrimidine reductase family protein n=1 Tax=Ruicaihuangia caeni TaxID=3042517 RepID=A0AAW6T4W4_9MICO|nr:pyrimidine reductase family protein [Klugiella sp. YN-L-19]MDI2098767.1 pyrimidine reductase family protein [Klugiella sp. YN-L-19]
MSDARPDAGSTDAERDDRISPLGDSGAPLTDEQLLDAYRVGDRSTTWLRANFVTSLDGAVTRQGRSGGLGDAADRRVFALLRRLADVVLVGAGTVRVEGYAGELVDGRAAQWREAHGLSRHPAFAMVSRALDLDPAGAVFERSPVRPIIVTQSADAADPAWQRRKDALADVADVLVCGHEGLDAAEMRRSLAERGLPQIHCEGGPSLFGSLVAQGAVDELCLTVSPTLEAGTAGRITHSEAARPTDMRLASVLRGGDTLLLRSVRHG